MYTRAQLEGLKVVDLKEILRSAGLKMTGAKADLIDRILAAKLGAPTKSPRAKSSKKVASPKTSSKKTAAKPGKGSKIVPVGSPPRSPARVVITPSVAATSNQVIVLAPPARAYDLESKAVIKAIVYEHPPRNYGPQMFTEISWSVSDPLSETGTFRDDEDEFIPLTDVAKQDLNRQFLGNRHSIYLYVGLIEDPNAEAGPSNEYLSNGGMLLLESPDRYPLTQWQVLRGLEQYFQWYMARNGGPDALVDSSNFEGIEFNGELNGVPVYSVSLN